MKTMFLAFVVTIVAGVGLWLFLGTRPGDSTAAYYSAGPNVTLPPLTPDAGASN